MTKRAAAQGHPPPLPHALVLGHGGVQEGDIAAEALQEAPGEEGGQGDLGHEVEGRAALPSGLLHQPHVDFGLARTRDAEAEEGLVTVLSEGEADGFHGGGLGEVEGVRRGLAPEAGGEEVEEFHPPGFRHLLERELRDSGQGGNLGHRGEAPLFESEKCPESLCVVGRGEGRRPPAPGPLPRP